MGALPALLVLLVGCAPELPPAWRIAMDDLDPEGQIDPHGKLRVLALRADPPEAAPGELVALDGLFVTHPKHAALAMDGTPSFLPRGLAVRYYLCRARDGLPAPELCDLDSGETRDLGEGPQGGFQVPEDAPTPATFLLMAVFSDEAQPGGILACLREVKAGAIARPNHCRAAIKRLKISRAPARNRNPLVEGLMLSANGDEQRLALLRAPAAVEREPDPDDASLDRDEALTTAFFTTAGRLESGRGAFYDRDCVPDERLDCPQGLRSDVLWTPPEGEGGAIEAPGGLVYFFAVLRDDRGGLSFQPLLLRRPP